MITNERQYNITRARAERFEQSLADVEERNAHLRPRIRQAIREAIESQLEEFRVELAEYEARRANPAEPIVFHTLEELPQTLILGRVAARLSQQELARRLGLKAQQIQRYEAKRYAGASIDRLIEVASALGLRIEGQGVLMPAVTAEGRTDTAGAEGWELGVENPSRSPHPGS